MSNKSSFRDITNIGMSDVVGTAISAIFWFYIASVIDPKQYGEIFFYIGIATICASIALLATQNSVIVYLGKKIPLQSTLYSFTLIGMIVGSTVLILLFYELDLVLIFVFFVIHTMAIGNILGRKKFSEYFKYNLIQKGLLLLLGIIFYNIFGVEGILYALGCSYIFFTIQVYRGIKNEPINLSLFKDHVKFISNNYVFMIVQMSKRQIDKLIIPGILGFTILGNYALALQIISIILIFPNIIFKYILPHDASGRSNKKIKVLTILISIVLAILGIIFAPILVPFIFSEYSDSIIAIQIMSVTAIPSTIMLIYTSKFLGMENSKFVLISKLISTTTIIVGMILLGQMYGLVGVAVAFLISNCSDAIFLILSDNYIKKTIKK